eukprot:28266_1
MTQQNYCNEYNRNHNTSQHQHVGFNISIPQVPQFINPQLQQQQQLYRYETSYLSSNCNQHSLIGMQMNNYHGSQQQLRIQQQPTTQFVTTYYQSDCNSHRVGNTFNYNQSQAPQPIICNDRNYGPEFVVNCEGLNTNKSHIGHIINHNTYYNYVRNDNEIYEPPFEKQKLNNNELNNNELDNKMVDIDERNKLIDKIMP